MLKTIELKATSENYTALFNWLNEIAELWNLSNVIANKINVCSEEIFVNIVSYAYKEDFGIAEISIEKSDNEIILIFKDEGFEYNPLQKEDPDINLSAEERQIGGLGIFMVKKTVDDIDYRYEDGKNILHIFKSF